MKTANNVTRKIYTKANHNKTVLKFDVYNQAVFLSSEKNEFFLCDLSLAGGM